MQPVEAIFIATGESPTVLTLADLLTGELQQLRAIGDLSDSLHTPAAGNSIIMKLPLTTENDVSRFGETRQWLDHHGSVLSSTEARKTIEFQTFFDSHTGSQILTVPNSIVRICANLGLDIANHVIRVLTQTECDTIRGNEN